MSLRREKYTRTRRDRSELQSAVTSRANNAKPTPGYVAAVGTRVRSDAPGEFVEMSGAEETASHELHGLLQLREPSRRRLRVGTVEVHGRFGKIR